MKNIIPLKTFAFLIATLFPAPAVVGTPSGLQTLAPLQAEASAGEADPVPASWWGEAPSPWTLPRGWTRIDGEVITTFGVRRAEDLAAFIPGASLPHRFGLTTAPNIRGESAEVYLNGIRRSSHLFGYRLSYHAIAQIDVLRGPASVIQGPGQHTGGTLFFTTLQPTLAENPGSSLFLDLGRLLPTQSRLSYPEIRLQLDHDITFEAERSGLRLSLEARRNATLYRRSGGQDDGIDLYLAYRHLFESGWEWNLAGQAFVEESPQLLGVNRPTQNLLSKGLYFTGQALDAPFGPLPLVSTTEVPLPRGTTLLSSDDFGRAQGLLLWLTGEQQEFGNGQLTLRSFLESNQRRRFHAFEYRENARQLTFEQRLEYFQDTHRFSTTAGAALRYERREAFVSYYNEFPFAWDLTSDQSSRSAARDYPLSYIPGVPGPRGALFFGPLDPIFVTPETSRSRLGQGGLFIATTAEFTSTLALNAGIRGDIYSAEAEDPLEFKASDSTTWGDVSGHLRLTWTPDPRQTFFAGASSSGAQYGSITGGGLMLSAPDGNLSPAVFRGRSDLIEAGWRQAWDNEGRWTTELVAFRQDRSRLEIFGPADIRVQGIEGSISVNPASAWSLALQASWQQGNYRNASPAELGGSSSLNLFAEGSGPDGAGTGLGLFGGFFGDSVPVGDWRLPGLSRWQLSPTLRVRPADGWEWILWGTVRSGHPGNLRQTLRYPSVAVLNSSLIYRTGRTEWTIDIFNLLDHRYFIHNGDTFFNNTLVGESEPLSLRLRYVRRF